MPPIYHITPIWKLSSIVASGGLNCDAEAPQDEKGGIAHEHIKERRARRPVTVGPGGTLADYVPFYFAPRSPMLYVNYKKRIPTNPQGQDTILHMVSSTELVVENELAFVFTNGHADIVFSDFFDDLGSLGEIDWGIMEAKYWSNSDEDLWRRQAEFLVHNFFPWNCITKVAVANETVQREVVAILDRSQHTPDVVVEPGWYY